MTEPEPAAQVVATAREALRLIRVALDGPSFVESTLATIRLRRLLKLRPVDELDAAEKTWLRKKAEIEGNPGWKPPPQAGTVAQTGTP